ncbi:MAG: phytanoyl-CoA dioxygenase family protein [candidate division Zixibacteria bacterium]|nr:phytanoyl-CoA dioxygenase family protein [candidate division Zixibacteria bacterium]
MTMESGPTPAERKQWKEDGYLVFEDAIRGEMLDRLQKAFDHWAAACKEDWLVGVARGELAATYYDIPNTLDKDDVFIDILDRPRYFEYVKAFTDDDMIFIGEQVRTAPLWPMGYTGWHPDVRPDHPLHIKVQVYVNDVERGGGEFAYVPGSHRPGAGPYPRVKSLEAMPGHRRFPGKAGTAVMFNTYGWHVAMKNRTETPRKSIILTYEKRTPGKINPGRYAHIAPSLNTPDRRRLFGMA